MKVEKLYGLEKASTAYAHLWSHHIKRAHFLKDTTLYRVPKHRPDKSRPLF